MTSGKQTWMVRKEWCSVLFALLCPIAPGAQIGLFALDLLSCSTFCIVPHNAIPQEVAEPEQLHRSDDLPR